MKGLNLQANSQITGELRLPTRRQKNMAESSEVDTEVRMKRIALNNLGFHGSGGTPGGENNVKPRS